MFFGPKRRPVSDRTYNVIKAGLSFNNFYLVHVKNYLGSESTAVGLGVAAAQGACNNGG